MYIVLWTRETLTDLEDYEVFPIPFNSEEEARTMLGTLKSQSNNTIVGCVAEVK